jgi:sulfide:quinone oxidoreductase
MRPLNEFVFVSGQVGPADMADMAEAGFEGVLCARPDGEMNGQPSAGDVGEAAKKAGLKFTHIPVIPGSIPSPDDAKNCAEFTRGKKVLIYCGSGPRAVLLNSLAGASEGRMLSAITAEAEAAGIDLGPIMTLLVDRGAQES